MKLKGYFLILSLLSKLHLPEKISLNGTTPEHLSKWTSRRSISGKNVATEVPGFYTSINCLDPGLYPGPGVYAGPDCYPKFYGHALNHNTADTNDSPPPG